MKYCPLQQHGWTQRILCFSETCWAEKDKYYVIITYMWNLKNTNERIYKTNWLTDIDKDLLTRGVTQGEKGKDKIKVRDKLIIF